MPLLTYRRPVHPLSYKLSTRLTIFLKSILMQNAGSQSSKNKTLKKWMLILLVLAVAGMGVWAYQNPDLFKAALIKQAATKKIAQTVQTVSVQTTAQQAIQNAGTLLPGYYLNLAGPECTEWSNGSHNANYAGATYKIMSDQLGWPDAAGVTVKSQWIHAGTGETRTYGETHSGNQLVVDKRNMAVGDLKWVEFRYKPDEPDNHKIWAEYGNLKSNVLNVVAGPGTANRIVLEGPTRLVKGKAAEFKAKAYYNNNGANHDNAMTPEFLSINSQGKCQITEKTRKTENGRAYISFKCTASQTGSITLTPSYKCLTGTPGTLQVYVYDDRDGDGVDDGVDNCPVTPNANQADVNLDHYGDVCEPKLVITGASSRSVGDAASAYKLSISDERNINLFTTPDLLKLCQGSTCCQGTQCFNFGIFSAPPFSYIGESDYGATEIPFNYHPEAGGNFTLLAQYNPISSDPFAVQVESPAAQPVQEPEEETSPEAPTELEIISEPEPEPIDDEGGVGDEVVVEVPPEEEVSEGYTYEDYMRALDIADGIIIPTAQDYTRYDIDSDGDIDYDDVTYILIHLT